MVGPLGFCDLVLPPLDDFITLADLVLLPEIEVGNSVGKSVGIYVEGGLEGLAAKHTMVVGLDDVLGERLTEGALDGMESSTQPLEPLLLLPLFPLLDFDESLPSLK